MRCQGEFCFQEHVDTLVRSIRTAFYKRSIPEQLLVDNGSISRLLTELDLGVGWDIKSRVKYSLITSSQ